MTVVGSAQQIITYLLAHVNDPVKWVLEIYREKRSLTQNAYYWALCGRVAKALRVSKYRVHNMTLRDYGQDVIIDGVLMRTPIPDTEVAEDRALESKTYHIRPTSEVRQGTDGKMYRTYVVMRGSSEYNTAEMTRLLDGMIQEAQALDIQTLTPDEIERMRQYELNQERKKAQKNNSDRDPEGC